jgi:hypothetical protein
LLHFLPLVLAPACLKLRLAAACCKWALSQIDEPANGEIVLLPDGHGTLHAFAPVHGDGSIRGADRTVAGTIKPNAGRT